MITEQAILPLILEDLKVSSVVIFKTLPFSLKTRENE